MYHYTLNGTRKELNCLTYNKEYVMFRMDRKDVLYGIVIIGITLFVIFNPFR